MNKNIDNPDKILSSEDYFITRRNGISEEEREARREAERAKKKILECCCQNTQSYIQECFDLGLTNEEFNIVRTCLMQHHYDNLAKWYKIVGEGRARQKVLDGTEICAEILDIISFLPRVEVQELLIEKMCESMIAHNSRDEFNTHLFELQLQARRASNLLKEKYLEATKKVNFYNPIQWKGTQKQLAELFIVLKDKGWIEDFDHRAIKACFTKSNTIHQVLKPGVDKNDGYKKTYDQVFTTNYDPVFYGIKPNPKSKK